jgi:hypothetical protein
MTNDSPFADKVGVYYFGEVTHTNTHTHTHTHTHINNHLLTHTLQGITSRI